MPGAGTTVLSCGYLGMAGGEGGARLNGEPAAPPGPDPAYRILGPLQITIRHSADSTRRGPVPPGRQQVILAALLLDANRVVGVDQLIDAVWDDEPPATARTQVQICVSRLRTNLASARAATTIATRPPGYLLQVAEDEVDVALFGRLVEQGDALARRGEHRAAVARFELATGLWRGPALNGLDSRILRSRAALLDRRRLGVLEHRAELRLRLGDHHQLVDELAALVDEHSLRERLRGQLMLALYRSGRRADALEVYRTGRELLVEELGLEPGEELRDLESAILAGADSIRLRAEPAAAETPLPASPPHQLPADTADFTGRDASVAELRRLLTGGEHQAVRVAALVGKPGVGKSTLAVHVAHQLAEQFPDGQLYTDLSGTRSRPATPAEALGRFLRALGVPGPAIPEHLAERAELYRTLLATKAVLVVLDDATSEAQVRPLLPGGGACAVLVTSRARLTGLPGVRVHELDVLDGAQAVDLLRAMIGRSRVDAEPAAAGALVGMVGGLPLALRIIGARLAARPSWPLAWMRERLSDERRRLDELAHGELMVRAGLTLTYDGLPERARRLLHLLADLDLSSFPTWAAAALLDTDTFDAADLLELLVDVQLLEITAVDLDGSPRYQFHEIIRLFAREQLDRHEPADVRRAAVRRVTGGWLDIAIEAHRRIYGGDFTVLHGTAPRWTVPRGAPERLLGDAIEWLDAERVNVRGMVAQAGRAGLDELCWDLAVTMVPLYESRCYLDDWQETHQRALVATRAAGNRRGTAALLCSLASMHLGRGRTEPAAPLIGSALADFVELGEVRGRGLARRNLALLDHLRGDVAGAEGSYRLALADFRSVDDPIGAAYVLGQLAHIEQDSGRLDQAEAGLVEALRLCSGIGSRRVEAQVRYRLSELMQARAEYAPAVDTLIEVLELVRAARDLVGEARTLHRLAVATAHLGRDDQARRWFAEAIARLELLMDAGGVAEVRAELARLGLDVTSGPTACPTTQPR